MCSVVYKTRISASTAVHLCFALLLNYEPTRTQRSLLNQEGLTIDQCKFVSKSTQLMIRNLDKKITLLSDAHQANIFIELVMT